MNRRSFATRLSFLAAALLPSSVRGNTRSSSGEIGQGKQVVGQGADKTQAGVYGVNFHGGDGVSGQSDSGRGVWGDSNSGIGVYGRSSQGLGSGVFGEGAKVGVRGAAKESAGGTSNNIGVFGTGDVGVRGVGSKFGVYGQGERAGVAAAGGGPNTTALEISNGAIKVTGAGVGTNTAVFKHVKTAGNSFYYNEHHEYGGHTIIDNSYANGDPKAILFITRDATEHGTTEPFVTVAYKDSQANPPQARNHWIIQFEGHDLSDGVKFNVMVIKP